MGRAKRLGSGSRDAGLAIEYVRTRKVIRLLGWLYDEPIAPVEIPVSELCRGLGIEPRDVGAPVQYLLFAGSHRRPVGGLRDLVAVFGSEDAAWAAFRALREDHPATQGWAELATIDGLGQVGQLAWFGLHPADDGADAPGVAAPRRVPRRLARPPASAAYLRAVTPS